MVEAISSYGNSKVKLNEIRKLFLEQNSESKLSSKKQDDSPRELSKKEIEKEIRLSKKSEEMEAENEEVIEEEPVEENSKIVVNASEFSSLNVQAVDANARIETSDSESEEDEYDEEMDFDKDGIVTDEERIRYYSEKYENYDSEVKVEQSSSFDAEAHTPQIKQNTTNPIVSNMPLVNKMQANYGKVTMPIKSGLEILV